MDLKLAEKQKIKYQVNQLWTEYQITLTGYQIRDRERRVVEKRQKTQLYVKVEDIFDIFIRFFSCQSNTIKDVLRHIDQLLQETDQIISFSVKNQYTLSQVSVLISLDILSNKMRLNLIDFTYFQKCAPSAQMLRSLKGLK